MLTNRFTLLALPLSVASLVLASCGGDGNPASKGASRAEMREAALDYAQCMREHGVDMPDPKFSANGGMSMQIGGPGSRKAPPKATMDAAQEACQKIMEKVKPPTMSPQEQAKAREQALKMARCMRQHGFDFPDPQFGKGGQIRQRIGGPNSGINPEDPRFQQAMQACQKASGGGPGAPKVLGSSG